MEVLSYIALILLSTVGYCAGAVGKAGKDVVLKPEILDLVLILAIWGGAIYSRIALDFNKWILIIVWLGISAIIGMIAVLPRKLHKVKEFDNQANEDGSLNIIIKLWHGWTDFSKRMGSFQSRILLSMFFFLLVLPFAIIVKFKDPLNVRNLDESSHWIPRSEYDSDLEQAKRQF